jgi:hypothetical protein
MRLQLASSLLLWLWRAALAHVKARRSGDHTEGASVPSISDAPARAVSQIATSVPAPGVHRLFNLARSHQRRNSARITEDANAPHLCVKA